MISAGNCPKRPADGTACRAWLTHWPEPAAAGTGFLDSEIALLREQLRAVARGVLDNYPATDGGTAVGNWQLMACVEALIDGDCTLANYHFSWFHAHARPSGMDLPR